MFPISKEEAFALDKNYTERAYRVCSQTKNCGGKTYLCYEDQKFKEFIETLRTNNVK